ncbi:MAG: TonB-dependent receptor, partial [Sinobacteraceae bacterium]|nr:TonB-dependent receptor [Nevskiaceae bacterium]
AQKRSEDVQTVPMSITTLGEQDLQRLHAEQLTDYAGYVPGLQMQASGTPAQGSISLRGISPIGNSSTVAMYLDETPLGSSSNFSNGASTVLDLLPYDIQGFEVLRGPQGTLYGASSLGGLLKYRTKAPDLEQFSGQVGTDVFSIDGGDKAGYQGRAAVNVPIVSGSLALRASFARQNTPGIIDNALSGARSQNPYSQQLTRIALLWKPTENISLSLSGIQQKIKADNNTYAALDATSLQPVYGKLKNDNIVPEPFAQDLDYFSATLNVNLGWADLISATGYSSTRTDTVTDATLIYGVVLPALGYPAGESTFNSDVRLRKTTEEVRLASKPGGTLEWLLGTFYTHENSQNDQLVSAQLFDGTIPPGLNPLAIAQLPSTYSEYAVFADITYKLNRLFDISGGARWARNDQDYAQISGGFLLPTANTPGRSAQSVVTYSLAPRWHINSDTMAYLRIASGYQPGGPNIALPGVPPSVNADKLTNYEIGLKTLLDNRRLQLDVAVFRINWKDIQVLATNGVVSYLVNGGTASSTGFELSTLYSPIEGLRLGMNAAYSDAKLTQDVPSIGGLSGDRLPFVPKWSGSASADYAFLHRADWTARVGGGVRYSGSRVTEVNHSPTSLPLKSYGVLDLNTEASNDRWTIRLFARNVTNKRVYITEIPAINGATGTVAEVHGVPLEPRVVGIGADVRF